ncbi:MAG TPA: D-alanyl-D-alanine carboxypeptidase family protein [Candidatus Binatia bacterium]|nr:D-alanyl-D-alanine carboxypeptidase family protein [Candidatus Binatia bacterium]
MLRRLAVTLCALAAPAVLAMAVPEPPELPVVSYALLDPASGQLLAGHEPDTRIEPASLTKLMTVYVAFDELRHGRVKLADEVLVSEKAWRQGIDSKESRMFIEVGKRVPVEALLHGIITQSGNDASIALAEHLGGDEATFAALMNQYARGIGLAHSHFVNATGVPDPEQYTTAHDIARLGQALLREFPEEYGLFKEKDYAYNGIRQPNRNLLLGRDPTVDGIKTGHAEKAGYHLAASAVREGRRLVAVVMGAKNEESRAQAAQALLNYGFRFFETAQAAAPNAPLATLRAWKGERTDLALGVLQPLVVSVPRGAAGRLQVQTHVDGTIFAPVKAGQKVGTLTVTLDGKTLRTEPLVALADLPLGGWWRRLVDSLRLWIQSLLGS